MMIAPNSVAAAIRPCRVRCSSKRQNTPPRAPNTLEAAISVGSSKSVPFCPSHTLATSRRWTKRTNRTSSTAKHHAPNSARAMRSRRTKITGSRAFSVRSRAPARSAVGSVELDAANLVTSGSSRQLHDHLVPQRLPDQSARERRGHGDEPVIDVGLVGADDLVPRLLFGIEVRERHDRTEAHAVARQLGRIDHLGARELVFDVLDPRFDQALALLGGVVLGVFAEVAVFARHADVPRDLRPF